MGEEIFSYVGKSRTGEAHLENQDRVVTRLVDKGRVLLAVADGMGGVAAGGLAAATAINCLEAGIGGPHIEPLELAGIIRDAGDQVISVANGAQHLTGMGTTLTTVLATHSMATWAHVGDSRLFHWRDGHLRQVTKDHRFLQELLDANEISHAEAMEHPLRNYLDQCVGSPDVQPDYGEFTIKADDLLLLTTDGLHDFVSTERMLVIINPDLDVHEIGDMLMKAALNSGSLDDISIVLARVRDVES